MLLERILYWFLLDSKTTDKKLWGDLDLTWSLAEVLKSFPSRVSVAILTAVYKASLPTDLTTGKACSLIIGTIHLKILLNTLPV